MDTNANSAPTSPAPPDASTNEEALLDKKRKALKKAQDDISTLQAEIKALQAKVAEVQQALAGYEASSQAMTKQLDDAKKLISEKTGIAEAVIKGDKAKVAQKIADFAKALADQGKKLQEAQSAAEAATASANAANTTALQKQADFDVIKKSPKDTDTALKELAGLLDQANKAEAQSDYISLYVLVTEAKALVDERIRIQSSGDYAASLRAAQDAVESAKKDAADKKAKADQAGAAYSDAKQKYDAAQASRRADLLAALKKTEPVAA